MFISNLRWGLVVRLLTVFSLCSFLQVMANQAGKQKVTVIASDVSLETVFKQIEKQTGLRFMYAVDAVNVNEMVTVSFKRIMLDEVLEALLKKKGIVWQYREGTISLKVEKKVAEALPIVTDPPITVTGRVLDAKGNPVPGATVMIKGGKKGAKTDEEGMFMIAGIELNAILLVSSIGFETKEIGVNSKNITVHMNEIIDNLDETIIKGYYTTTGRLSLGNVTRVKGDDIAKQPVTDPLLALQGRVPGMTITQTTGMQGGQINVQIRGRNSLSNGTQPLFIVDGIPYTPTVSVIGGFGAIGNVMSALNFVNPSDIESIDILKDADATAIYGSRGANGVILITTKKGKIGNTRIDINVYRGWGNVIRKRKLLNSNQYLEMRREAFKNDNVIPSINNAPDLFLWDTTRYTDWQKEMLGGNAEFTDAQASISGGTSIIQYLIRGNFHRQTTVFPGEFPSINGGTHFSIGGSSPNQKLRTILTGSYSVSNANVPTADFAGSVDLPPVTPNPYNADGTLNWANSTWVNPYASILYRKVDVRTSNLLGNLDASYRLLPALIVKANLGYNELNNNNFNEDLIAGKDPRFMSTNVASATFTNSATRSWIFEPQLNYNINIGLGTLNALLGATLLGNRVSSQRLFATGIKDDALIRNPASAASFTASGAGSNYKYAAFFSRLEYNLQNRYLLNVTLRRDGSSRFGSRKRFASFGAIAGGWIFSQEKFVKDILPVMSYGKLRLSYGTTGNDQIGDYQYLDRYEYIERTYQGVKGLRALGVYNADFAWELTRKMEVGLETGFVKDKLLCSASYFKNRSTNQLIGYPLPSLVGTSIITGNLPAVIQNRGFEVVITSRSMLAKNFEWSNSFNISFVKNMLISYSGNGAIYARVGQSLTERYLYKELKVNADNGTYLFANEEGKPVPSNEADPSNVSIDIAPKYFGGLQSSIRFKGITFDVNFQYVKQKGAGGVLNPSWIPGSIRNQPIEVLDRWRKDGDEARMQRFSQNFELRDGYIKFLGSDRAFSDASFIRCKSLGLAWQIPLTQRVAKNLSSCRLYIQTQNLFTITRYSGLDPETQSVNAIPPLRVITVGAQLSL